MLRKAIVMRNELYEVITFSESLDLEAFCCFEKGWQRVLGNVNFPCIHKFQNRLKMVEWNVLENYNGMLGWIVLRN